MNIKINIAVLAFSLIQISVFQLFAQDGKSNWLNKQKNKEEKSESIQVESTNSDSLKMLLEDYLKPEKNVSTDLKRDSITPSQGRVTIITDYGIELLNDSLIKSPAPVPGYRIQIFFGSLDQAKNARANFIRNHSDIACNIEQITPSFSVRAGNFRNQQEAYKVLLALKPEYPGAIIVSDNIDFPELPE